MKWRVERLKDFDENNWMIVGSKRGHVSLSTKQGSRIVISILCMPSMAGYFLQVINNCYNTHFQVPILPRLKLTTIISFFYGHYGEILRSTMQRMRNKFISKGHSAEAWHHACVHSPTAGHSGYAADDFPAEHDSPYARYDMPFHRTEEVPDTLFDIHLLLGHVWRSFVVAILDSTRWRIAWIIIDRLHISVRGCSRDFEY
ncbi:hypothetical protein AAG906_020932 [Vitis piasezkii]